MHSYCTHTHREHHGRAVSAKKAKVGVEREQRTRGEDDVYLHYTPADLYSEKGLVTTSIFTVY